MVVILGLWMMELRFFELWPFRLLLLFVIVGCYSVVVAVEVVARCSCYCCCMKLSCLFVLVSSYGCCCWLVLWLLVLQMST